MTYQLINKSTNKSVASYTTYSSAAIVRDRLNYFNIGQYYIKSIFFN